ncbi:MAG TPA: putative baseplate assembly protein [Thermoanaerobaculia bacterium]|nr:putative baseplate assembly protein [Thermoanaerobaculia bacterium]
MKELTCRDERRRQHIRERDPHNGVDYVDVTGKHLCVHFLNGIPDVFLNVAEDQKERVARHIVIKGGRRITGIQVLDFDADATDDVFDEDCLGLEVDRTGDWSTYTLCFVKLDEQGRPTDEPLLDPRYSCVELSFKIDCPAEIDCKADTSCPPEPRPPRTINYLAKDYASFRQLILDRLSLLMPDWRERHVPDIGIAIVEVLAYVGDFLSYYQDAVATEAYLDTARQRISVRRHVRLVDYAMHEGCNARVFLFLEAAADAELAPPFDFFFITRPPESDEAVALRLHELAVLKRGWIPFEPLTDAPAIRLRLAHNLIAIYTWGNQECCIPRGATRATLVDAWIEEEPQPQYDDSYEVQLEHPKAKKKKKKYDEDCEPPPKPRKRTLDLRVGDFLLFEELACAGTVSKENFDGKTPEPDADPTHRHVVRLTKVTPIVDPLFDLPLVEAEWSREDAMPFTLCVSAIGKADECDYVEGLAVARANLVLADHGLTIRDETLAAIPDRTPAETCDGEDELAEIAFTAGRYRPALQHVPLTFAQPLVKNAPATEIVRQNPRAALPALTAWSIPAAFDGASSLFTPDDLRDPRFLAKELLEASEPARISLRNRLRPDVAQLFEGGDAEDPALLAALAKNLRALLEAWKPRPDLLDSGRDDAELVAEIDDDGRAHLRFGDGVHGRAVEVGTTFLATYRAGNGRAGLVGRESIVHIVFPGDFLDAIASVRNPLPSGGAIDPEPVSEVRMYAPFAFRKDLQRAVIAEDYGALAQYLRYPTRNPDVQSASAELRWNGSWYEANVAIDPSGGPALRGELADTITGSMHRVRRMGHDLRLGEAAYVPLLIDLEICIDPRHLRAHVLAAVRDALRAFFQPDNLTFGQSIHASRIIAVVQNIEGVTAVRVERLERLDARTFDDAPASPATAVLLGPNEVARLDHDPVIPENGILRIDARGGR